MKAAQGISQRKQPAQHLSQDQVYAIFEQSVSSNEQRCAMMQHVETCLDCQTRLAQLQQNNDTLVPLRQQMGTTPLISDVESALSATKARAEEKRPGRYSQRVAALALVLVAAVSIYPSRQPASELVATTKHRSRLWHHQPARQNTSPFRSLPIHQINGFRRKGSLPTKHTTTSEAALFVGLYNHNRTRLKARLHTGTSVGHQESLALAFSLKQPGGYAYLFWDRPGEPFHLLYPSQLQGSKPSPGATRIVVGQGKQASALPLARELPGEVMLLLVQTRAPLEQHVLAQIREQRKAQQIGSFDHEALLLRTLQHQLITASYFSFRIAASHGHQP